MYRSTITKIIMVMAASSTLLVNSVLADESLTRQAEEALQSAGKKVEHQADAMRTKINDATITEEIRIALLRDDDTRGIRSKSITTHYGVVSIVGFVSTAALKKKIETIVLSVRGVKSVNNKLRIYPEKNPKEHVTESLKKHLQEK